MTLALESIFAMYDRVRILYSKTRDVIDSFTVVVLDLAPKMLRLFC